MAKKRKTNRIKKDLSSQMKMFEEGGLKEEGGMVDEVSGNDVPIGSTREEVRDDIPAQLSEGEFVFPADVVRFIGLEKLMEMRQEAKAGLKRMEEMGQMGNADEAKLPDDMPFSMEDLDIEEQENEEEGEVTDSNFNQGGIVTMAEGGTIPTTENTDLNKDIENKSLQTPIPQQRTMVQQKPLNVRQQNVPMRGMVTNIPKAEDFLKRKTTKATTPYSFLDVAPTDLGSRYTGKFKSKTEEVQKSIGDVKNELDAVLSDVSDGADIESPSGGGQSSSLDYSEVDRFALDDDLRGVFNDFSKAQLSMFGVVTSNPFGLAISGIGTQLGPMTGGKTVQGPVYSAELGKIQAKAFHQVALDVTNKYGVKSLNSLPAAGQKELATQGRVHMDFAKDIYNASVGKPYSSFSFNAEDKKGFVDTAKDIVNAVMSIGKTQAAMPTPEIAAKEKALSNLKSQITNLAQKSLQTKNNKTMLDTVNAAVEASKTSTPTVDVDELGNINQANQYGFNAYGTGIADRQGTVVGVDKFGVISYGPKHNWGKWTQTRVKSGKTQAEKDAEVEAALDAISQEAAQSAQGKAEKGFTDMSAFGDTDTSTSTGTGTSMGAADMGLGDISTDNDGGSASSSSSQGSSSSMGMDDDTSAQSQGPGGSDTAGDSSADGSEGTGKIICTAMNKMYGLPMYSNRVWMRYNKYKKLDNAWELGYHKIFLSLVKKMPTNKYIRKSLEWFANTRTHGLKEEMKGNMFTVNTLILRPLFSPIVYITGKLVQKGILKKADVKSI
jgi:hypothetical protein